MKEQLVTRINERTRDLNNLLDHRDALRKEINAANIKAERLTAQIVELKELLETLMESETSSS